MIIYSFRFSINMALIHSLKEELLNDKLKFDSLDELNEFKKYKKYKEYYDKIFKNIENNTLQNLFEINFNKKFKIKFEDLFDLNENKIKQSFIIRYVFSTKYFEERYVLKNRKFYCEKDIFRLIVYNDQIELRLLYNDYCGDIFLLLYYNLKNESFLFYQSNILNVLTL